VYIEYFLEEQNINLPLLINPTEQVLLEL